MASLSLLQSNYTDPDAQLESDIADEHHELNHAQDEEQLPPRPTSRIGFNSSPPTVALEPPVPPTRPRAGTLKWTRNLFQKIGRTSVSSQSSSDVDMDITAASTTLNADDEDDLDPLSLPVLPSLSSACASTSSLNLTDMDVDTGSSYDDDDSDSDGYSSGDSDIDLDSPTEYGQGGRDVLLFPPIPPPTEPLPSPPPAVPPAVPPSSPVPYAIIAPTTAPLPPLARRPTSLSTSLPVVRTKYSCLPSPLSPSSDDRTYYTNPMRHAYGHHGRSRHALLHLKYLWALREDQWDEHANRARDSYAYCGMTPPRVPPRHAPPRLQTNFVAPPPMTIHPRRGDLTALRDPYCAHMDRCFVGLPLWTMGKTLWMYDVHMLSEGLARARKPIEPTSEDEDSEGESMAASISTAGFSDDSDETLVESESGRSVRSEDEVLEEVDLDMPRKDVKAPASPPRPRSAYLDSKRPLALSASTSTPPSPHWETSWYKRWEILIELVRLDTERERQRMPPAPLAVRPPRFFIGEEEDENDESWDEDRWDEVLGHNDNEAGELQEDEIMIVSNEVLVGC